MNRLLIIGASGHAKVIIDIVEKQGQYEILGLVDTFKHKNHSILGYNILGTEDMIPELIKTHKISGGIIAIGDNCIRKHIYNKIKKSNPTFNFITAIHPSAVLAKNITIGKGTVVMAGVVVNSDVVIGIQTILNTKCAIDHDSTIGDFSSVAPGATLGGNVTIGSCSAVSLGANIIENISIGENTIIGAGALVLKSFGDKEIVYGLPAKTIRERKKTDRYLGLSATIQKNSETYKLNFKTIRNDEDVKTYYNVLNKFNEINTFYSLEYCNHSALRKMSYLSFQKNDKYIILLPIYLNERTSLTNKTSTKYYEACSPYGFSGPLINQQILNQDINQFWMEVDTWYKSNNIVTEFIRFNLNDNYYNYSGTILPTLKTIKGELTDFNQIWNNFKQKVRTNYRRAEKNGLRAEIYSKTISQENITRFYEIYIKTMERNKAENNYFYTIDYFENLINNNSTKTAIVLIYKNSTPISTELIIIDKDTMFSFLGGTISKFFELRPNDFLKIEVIKWGLENNLKYYALGGGRADNDGLYKYKKSFFPNDEDITFYTGRKIINHHIYQALIKDIVVNHEIIEDPLTDIKAHFPIYNGKKK